MLGSKADETKIQRKKEIKKQRNKERKERKEHTKKKKNSLHGNKEINERKKANKQIESSQDSSVGSALDWYSEGPGFKSWGLQLNFQIFSSHRRPTLTSPWRNIETLKHKNDSI